MSTVRPTISVRCVNSGDVVAHVPTPAVFSAPIRPDIVRKTVQLVETNVRNPQADAYHAGYKHSAESWGAGRAVARLPRIKASGTNRAAQTAFGNQVRGGGRFGRKELWRKIHHLVAKSRKRYALSSILAASAWPQLAEAKGHEITKVPEFPIVANDNLEDISTTSELRAALVQLGLEDELTRVLRSKRRRSGVGKWRNRATVMRRGPCIVYSSNDNLKLLCPRIAGVSAQNVKSLNITELAPGGVLGRVLIFTKSAIQELDTILGTYQEKGTKSGFSLPRARMANTDLDGLYLSPTIRKLLNSRL